MKQRTGLAYRLVIVPALAACLFATAAASGSISFGGAIVPSSYRIVVLPAAPEDGGIAVRAAKLQFVASPADRKSAVVRFERPDREPMAIRCGAGTRPTSGPGCRLGDLGDLGGSLTLAPPAGPSVPTVATTTYD